MPKIIRVVNWHQYQHYKDRNPPWIKLYTRLIDGDSREFLKLKDEIKWQFCAILMLASRQQNAIVLDEDWISTRLRLNKPLNLKALEATGMIEVVEIASASLADREQIAIPETETETETEERQSPGGDPAVQDGFQSWYRQYPRRVGKIKAAAAWGKLTTADREAALAAVATFSASWAVRPESDFQFCPHPTTWLNGRRWEDEGAVRPPPAPPTPEEEAAEKERLYWVEKKRVADEEQKRANADFLRRLKEGGDAGAH
jgi:hypothetical protein